MPSELQCWTKPRPLRVAFLVQDGEHAHLALDGIFADCHSRWGGRFSLIVPCIDNRITPAYWPWLEAYDPDIVFSYVGLSREDILEIHERIGPSQYMRHNPGRSEPRLDVHGFKPEYRFKPLSSLSTIFQQARYGGGLGPSASLKMIDVYSSERATRFFTDNFGTYVNSMGSGMVPNDALSVMSLRTVLRDEIFSDRRHGVPRDIDRIPDELTAFSEFATRKATSLSLSSILFASKLELRDHHRWSGSFNLVVGDTFSDRILYWNARLLLPAWLDTDLNCLRIERSQLDSPDFLATLISFINNRNHVNSGSGGQPELTIRSTSLSVEQLEEVRTALQTSRPWSNMQVQAVGSLDELVPDSRTFAQAREAVWTRGLNPPPSWTRFVWTPPTIRPPATSPDHLADAPPRQQFAEGYWCSEYNIEYDGHGPRFSNSNRWLLPRRWPVAGAFKLSLPNQPANKVPPPARSSRNGNLALFVSDQSGVESITVPTPSEAIFTALHGNGGWGEDNLESGRVVLTPKIAWADPSNEARYLNGVLGMAAGVGNAAAFLLHPFLREMFATLGGAPNMPAKKVQPTANSLVKVAVNNPVFDLREQRERTTLANLIVKAAANLKTPQAFFSYDDLKASWTEYRAAYWAAHPLQHAPDTSVDWDRHEADSLDACLIAMRQRQMLFQGHRWLCKECHHKNWRNLGSIEPELTCEVCRTISQAPVDIRWLFRANEFLIESLRDHSVLSLIWVLTTLANQTRNSFIYEGPTKFGLTHEAGNPDFETDLLILADGKTHVCEVKSSWSVTRASDIQKLVDISKKLRPDVALLAVMEEAQEMGDQITAARAELEPVGIEFRLMTWRQQDEDAPHLPG